VVPRQHLRPADGLAAHPGQVLPAVRLRVARPAGAHRWQRDRRRRRPGPRTAVAAAHERGRVDRGLRRGRHLARPPWSGPPVIEVARASRSESWFSRNGWMLAAMWLVFLVFPWLAIMADEDVGPV